MSVSIFQSSEKNDKLMENLTFCSLLFGIQLSSEVLALASLGKHEDLRERK